MLTISKQNGIHRIGPTLNSFCKWCSFQWHSVQECISPKTNMELENTPWKETFINHHLFWFPCLFSDVAHMCSLLRNHILWQLDLQKQFPSFFSSLEFLDDLLVTLGTLLSANIYINIYIYIFLYIHEIIDIHDKSTLRQLARWQVSKTHGCLAKTEVY